MFCCFIGHTVAQAILVLTCCTISKCSVFLIYFQIFQKGLKEEISMWPVNLLYPKLFTGEELHVNSKPGLLCNHGP